MQHLDVRYHEIKNSNLEYSCKNEELNRLLTLNSNNSIELSYLYNDFGKLNYRNNDIENAVINTTKALNIQKLYADSIPSIINKSYNNIALFHLFSGNEPMAIQTFNELISQPYVDKYTIHAYTKRLTDLYISRGDYYKVIHYLQEIENKIIKSEDPKHKKELYRVYLSFSRVYSKTMKAEDYKKAILYLKKVEESIVHLPKKIRQKTSMILYARYGWIYEELEEYEDAIYHYSKALEIGLNDFPTNNKDIATAYDALGYIYAKTNQYPLAYQYYQEALQYDPLKTSTYDNLGDYFLYKKEYTAALQHYQKAISYTIGQYTDVDYNSLLSYEELAQSNNKTQLVNDLKDKANAWYIFYQNTKDKLLLKKALSTIILADRGIDIIRSENVEQQSKYFWRRKGVDLYMLGTAICYELNDISRAFFFMEKSKSLSLLEDITHEEAKNEANLPENIKEREYSLKYTIHKERERLLKDTTLTRLEKESIIFEHKNKYERFINSLEERYPGYYHYKKKITISSLETCKSKIISPSTGLIQYILKENEGYGILVTTTKTHFFKIKDPKKLNREIRRINTLINTPFISKNELDTYNNLAFSLYQQLFPFYTEIDTSSIENLLIVPDFILNSFPFEALVTQPDTTKNEISYLIKNLETTYAYSVSLLEKIEQKERSPRSQVLAFAPTHFTNKLPSLLRSKSKMEALKSMWHSTILEEHSATKSNFITMAEEYNIIHLSTHANAISVDEPWIAFHDSILTLNELYFIKNQADLVFLDACKTGTGYLQSGEGMMSLSRGFFHAGAKNVISSLWSTNEKSSSKIVLDFYTFLKNGESKSSALRKAKLKYLNEHQLSEQSPHFWAPLILHGNIETSNTSNTYLFWVFYSILAVCIICLFFWRINNSKKNKKPIY
ncbi:CHAT domain-containing protein [Aquimarina pacifica]|uniref:CHAT domain-containing protein n=1 Tax=Aquimarina pacifica TaxID=1296415 RepID=UPI00046E7424|nr:CHAT domain-containing protein [Aquimarina pacifica]